MFTLYDYIFDFLSSYIFISHETAFLGATVPVFDFELELAEYLAHTCTIIILILFFIALINLVLWCFKLGRHLLHL